MNNQKARSGFLLVVGVLLFASCEQYSTAESESATARNVILFVGDGMGISTVTATRIFDGQSRGGSGEEHVLPFETFPNVALVKTYNTNQQVPDSAGTITAMLTGKKTRAGLINVAPNVLRKSCEGALEYPLEPISEQAQRQGKAIGVVTTTRLTHATPAGLYSRTPERNWEDDHNIALADWNRGCHDIAWQLVHHPNGGPDVAMGGGSRHFFGADLMGERRNASDSLVRTWLSGGEHRRYVTSAEQLDSLRSGNQVLGLFASSHMTYVAEKSEDSTEPSLTEMATTAVRLLRENEEGFFLLVEGGRIDHGHHDCKPGYALLEAQEFSNAVDAVLDMVDIDETLVLVTADHSHAFTLGGYPTRGNPILGLVVQNDSKGQSKTVPELADDGQPYTTLAYASGAGSIRTAPRTEPSTGIGMVPQSLVPVTDDNMDGTVEYDETHSGEDVAVYAIGPGAEAVRGVIEQDRLYDIMIEALGWVN